MLYIISPFNFISDLKYSFLNKPVMWQKMPKMATGCYVCVFIILNLYIFLKTSENEGTLKRVLQLRLQTKNEITQILNGDQEVRYVPNDDHMIQTRGEG